MLTATQKSYELCIIQVIDAFAHHPEQYLELTAQFIEHKESYYDILCDNLYRMANDSSNCSLWLRSNGLTYLSVLPLDSSDLLLLFQPNLVSFDDDITELLQKCRSRLEHLIYSLVYKRKALHSVSALTAY